MAKSKKDELKKEKDDVRKEFEKLIFDNPEVSHELHAVFIDLFNNDNSFRKRFGLKPVNRDKTPPAFIDDPVYSEIVQQLLQGKGITKVINDVGVALSETDLDEDVDKSIKKVHRFYYETAGGQNKKNIQKTVRGIQYLQSRIDNPVYFEVVEQLKQGKSIELALTDAGHVLGKTESQMSDFYNRGDYKKYIQNNLKQAQKLINMNKK